MDRTLEIVLKILGIVIMAAGFVLVYAAPKIVDKYRLDAKARPAPDQAEEGMDEEQLRKIRRESAILSLKIKGVLIALPGALMILILYKI